MALLASVSERQYENTYARAQDLFQMSQQSDFPDPRLGKTLALMVNDFVGTCKQVLNSCSVRPNRLSDEFRRRTFTLVSRAFACLQVAEAQRLLGMGQKDVLASELDSRRHTPFSSLTSYFCLKLRTTTDGSSTAPTMCCDP